MNSEDELKEFRLINFLFETKFSILIENLMEDLVWFIMRLNTLGIRNIISFFFQFEVSSFLSRL